MRHLIKQILIEESDVVPNLAVANTWVNGKSVPMAKPPKDIFFKVVKQVALTDPGGILGVDDSSYEDRAYEMESVVKLFSLNTNYQALINKIFWAAIDNREGLEDGSVNSFEDLNLRQYKKYRVECSETWTEHVYYSWAPTVTAYSEDDAVNDVVYDEDGLYQYYEWTNEPGYMRDVGDVDSEGKEVDHVEEIGIVNESRIIKENSWQVTDDDKWNKLEKDLRYVVERLIQKHKDNWGGDQYAVMGAIEQVLEGMYQKVRR